VQPAPYIDAPPGDRFATRGVFLTFTAVVAALLGTVAYVVLGTRMVRYGFSGTLAAVALASVGLALVLRCPNTRHSRRGVLAIQVATITLVFCTAELVVVGLGLSAECHPSHIFSWCLYW